MTLDTSTLRSARELVTTSRAALAGGVTSIRKAGADLGHSAADAVDTQRDAVAATLDTVAHGLHSGATSAADVGRITDGVADTLDHAAAYVRRHDAHDMTGDVESLIRLHLGKTLLGVLAIGYLAGRVLHRPRTRP